MQEVNFTYNCPPPFFQAELNCEVVEQRQSFGETKNVTLTIFIFFSSCVIGKCSPHKIRVSVLFLAGCTSIGIERGVSRRATKDTSPAAAAAAEADPTSDYLCADIPNLIRL